MKEMSFSLVGGNIKPHYLPSDFSVSLFLFFVYDKVDKSQFFTTTIRHLSFKSVYDNNLI